MAGPATPGSPLPVAGNGDFNGDAFSDVIIGEPMENESRGRVRVFYGGPTGLKAQPDWSYNGQRPDQHLGFTVAMAGDIDGDGIDDLVMSAWQGDYDPEAGPGAIYLFLGSSNGLPAAPSQTLPPDVGRFHLWVPLAAAGDVNGDGYADLAVLATDLDQPPDRRKALLVFYGSPGGLRLEPACVAHSEQEASHFGHDFVCAGDVNGDGYDDLLLGAMKFTGRTQNGSKAYLFLGSPTGLQTKPAWTMEYPLPADPRSSGNQFFSCGLGAAGDVNGDGFDDVIIGAWFAGRDEAEEGGAFLFLGSKTGLGQRPDWVIEGGHPHVLLGQSVAGAGDVNGDGFDDVLVGVPYAEHGQKDEGVALVFHGSKKGLGRDPAWTFDGDRSHGHLGELVLAAGDLNGDGVPDLLLAGHDAESTDNPRTRVVAIYGPRGGLKGSSYWRLRKPLLALAQQRLDEISTGRLWLGTTALAASLVVALLFVQARLRRRIAVLVAENQQLALARERARLARDLHDHLGADLTHLAVQLEQTRRKAGLPEVEPQLGRLSAFAGRLVDAVRELVWAMKPECDTLDSAATFLSEQIAGFLEANDLRCDLDFPLDLPAGTISTGLRHNLVLMVKETLNNVVKHARATRVEAQLRVVEGRLNLRISDDGCGFDPASLTAEGGKPKHHHKQGGHGLINLHRRAADLGGRCAIHATPGHGTTVEFDLPIAGLEQRSQP